MGSLHEIAGKNIYRRGDLYDNRVNEVNTQTQTPEMGVKDKGHYFEVFLGGLKVTLGPRELWYLRRISQYKVHVPIYDPDVFGVIPQRYVRFHAKRIYGMESKGLIKIEINDGCLSAILTPLGVKVLEALEKAK